MQIGWLSASILHDLRNPLGTICAGAELLMDLDSTSTQVKRLAANMCRCGAASAQPELTRGREVAIDCDSRWKRLEAAT